MESPTSPRCLGQPSAPGVRTLHFPPGRREPLPVCEGRLGCYPPISQWWVLAYMMMFWNRRPWVQMVLLTHWGRVTHICVSKLTTIGSDNGLSPGRRQAIIWTNAGILLIGPLGINFSEIIIEIITFSFDKMHLKMSSAKWRLFRLGLNELSIWVILCEGGGLPASTYTQSGRKLHFPPRRRGPVPACRGRPG